MDRGWRIEEEDYTATYTATLSRAEINPECAYIWGFRDTIEYINYTPPFRYCNSQLLAHGDGQWTRTMDTKHDVLDVR